MEEIAVGGCKRAPHVIAPVLTLVLLAACGQQKTAAQQPPVAIKDGDTSMICGMYITRHPGPRAEVYLAGVKKVLKFGNTRDFFAYITRSDISPRLEMLYVQDTARIDWAHPSNAADSFIDARQAYYVAWQPIPGAMGPTFASFAGRGNAMDFVRAHGGAVLQFNQMTSALAAGLAYKCPAAGAPLYQLAVEAKCVIR